VVGGSRGQQHGGPVEPGAGGRRGRAPHSRLPLRLGAPGDQAHLEVLPAGQGDVPGDDPQGGYVQRTAQAQQ
jgi:hypothetical protein